MSQNAVRGGEVAPRFDAGPWPCMFLPCERLVGRLRGE